MSSIHIKTCPHCGGPSCLNQRYNSKARTFYVFVRCDICGASGKTYRSEEEPAAEDWSNAACEDAVTAWNMRTPAR